MIDHRTIRVFMAGMASMSALCILAMGGAFLYDRWTHDPAEDAVFEAEMQAHKAVLAEHGRVMAEHQRQMDEYQRQWETRRQAREAHDEVPREEKGPCP